MKLHSIASLAVACVAVVFCGAFAQVRPFMPTENEPRKYPTVVSCSLTMTKVDTNIPDPFDELPNSCNHFSVQNADEYKFVEVGCRFAQVLQGSAFKVENAACRASRAYATCRVMLGDQNPEPIDTYYFLGKDRSNSRDAQEEMFRSSCENLGGEFLK